VDLAIEVSGMCCLVTTSWDDDSLSNRKTASILNKFGILGTFYISGSDLAGSFEDERIRRMVLELYRSGHEIGAHTKNHSNLTECQCAVTEIRDFKKELEDFLTNEVISFAYPYGKYNAESKEYVKISGFKYARSTNKWSISLPQDVYEAGVTTFASKHLVLRDRIEFICNFFPRGISRFMRWIDIAKFLFDLACEHSGVFHLYGHSWELEAQGQWDMLVELFRYMKRKKGVTYVTNGGLLEFL